MGLINPDNLAILLRHVRCAAFELPFEVGEHFGHAGDVGELWVLDQLSQSAPVAAVVTTEQVVGLSPREPGS